jgi:hypothetical protein
VPLTSYIEFNRAGYRTNKLVEKLVQELPELLADYKHGAHDVGGKVDSMCSKRVARIDNIMRHINRDGQRTLPVPDVIRDASRHR